MNDILINGGELMTEGGDFVTGYSHGQHQEHLLVFQKGALKGSPETCVGLENYLMDSDIDGMVREIWFQFEKDGMNVKDISYDEAQQKLDYDADYRS